MVECSRQAGGSASQHVPPTIGEIKRRIHAKYNGAGRVHLQSSCVCSASSHQLQFSCSSLSRPDVPVAKLRLMLKGENLEDERSAQDYHIRRDEVLTLILKEPDGNAAQTAQVLRDGVNPHTSHMCNGCAD